MSDLTPGDPLRRKAVELEAGEVALHVGIVQDHNVRWAHLLGDSCIIAGEPLLTEILHSDIKKKLSLFVLFKGTSTSTEILQPQSNWFKNIIQRKRLHPK